MKQKSKNNLDPPAPPRPRDGIGLGYEPGDVGYRGPALFVVGLVAFAVLMHTGLWFVLQHYVDQRRPVDVPRSVMESDGTMPPSISAGAPLLQPSPPHAALPKEDLLEMRKHENEVFAHLRWTDDGSGRMKIPDAVVRAVAQRTHPTTTAASQPASQVK